MENIVLSVTLKPAEGSKLEKVLYMMRKPVLKTNERERSRMPFA